MKINKSSLGQNTQPKLKKNNLDVKGKESQTVSLINVIRKLFEKRVFKSTLRQPVQYDTQ